MTRIPTPPTARPSTSSSASSSDRRKSGQNTYASVIEGYASIEIIGKGSFGSIRKVARKTDGKLFARKELCYDRMTDRDRKQIVAEVNILKALNHKNIVKYEERFADADANMLYIVMEYCQGGDLGSVIKKCRRSGQRLPEDTVWSYFSQLVQALDACHNGMPVNGNPDAAARTPAILHRDIKPENVFLNHEEHVKLGDFGLSKQLGAAHTFANTYVGTPYYMSPELATGGSYDIKSDIWALGCVVFELCSLSPPFDATSQAELTIKIKSGQVPCLPRGYSRELGDVIREMLALNPRRRPTTRQLLEVPQIKFTLKTLDLTEFARQLTAREAALAVREDAQRRPSTNDDAAHLEQRQTDLDAREYEIEQRERSVDARQYDVEQREHSIDARLLELDSQEAALRQQSTHLDEQRTALAEQFELLQTREADFDAILRAQVESRVASRLAAEKESWRAAVVPRGAGPRVSDAARRQYGSGGGEQQSTSLSTARLSGAVVSSRPVPLARRTSGDASMDGVAVRRTAKFGAGAGGGVAAANSMPASSASGARRRRSAVASAAAYSTPVSEFGASRRSTTSDGWVDDGNDNVHGEGDDDGDKNKVNGEASQRASAPSPSASIAAATSSSSSLPAQAPPRKPRTSAVSRLLEREGYGHASAYNPAADKSDITMKDVTIDEKENSSCAGGAAGSAYSSPILRGQQQRARRVTLEHRLAQEAAEEEERLAAAAAAEEEDSPTVRQQQEHAATTTATRPTATSSWGADSTPPIYDISNDPDLPSPFLRKTTGGSGAGTDEKILKGVKMPAQSFIQRAAALRAAHNARGTGGPHEATPAAAAAAAPRQSATGGASSHVAASAPQSRSTAPLPVRRSTTTAAGTSSSYTAPSARLASRAAAAAAAQMPTSPRRYSRPSASAGAASHHSYHGGHGVVGPRRSAAVSSGR